MTRMERPTATMARLLPRRRVIRRYRSPRKVSVLLAATAASPSTRASYGLPCPVDPLPLRLPADSLTPGANLAHDTRCPAVGNRVMSVPSSASSRRAATWPTPGISSSRSTAPAKPAISSASLASSSARSASRASTRASILASRKACWSVKNPQNASTSGPSLARNRVRASCARTLGSRSPATSAASMARPETPKMSLAPPRVCSGRPPAASPPAAFRRRGPRPGRPGGGPRLAAAGSVVGDEAGPQHLPLGELAQPDRVQGVGLGPSRQVLDVTGIHQPDLEPVGFQQVVDPLPRIGPDLLQPPARAALAGTRTQQVSSALPMSNAATRWMISSVSCVSSSTPASPCSDQHRSVARRSRRATGESDPRAQGDSEGPTARLPAPGLSTASNDQGHPTSAGNHPNFHPRNERLPQGG